MPHLPPRAITRKQPELREAFLDARASASWDIRLGADSAHPLFCGDVPYEERADLLDEDDRLISEVRTNAGRVGVYRIGDSTWQLFDIRADQHSSVLGRFGVLDNLCRQVGVQIARSGLTPMGPLTIPDLVRLVEGYDVDIDTVVRPLRRLNDAEFVNASKDPIGKFATAFGLDLSQLAFNSPNVYASRKRATHARPQRPERHVHFTLLQEQHVEEMLRLRKPNQVDVFHELTPSAELQSKISRLKHFASARGPHARIGLQQIIEQLKASGVKIWYGTYRTYLPVDVNDPPHGKYLIRVIVIALTDASSPDRPSFTVPPEVPGLGLDIYDGVMEVVL